MNEDFGILFLHHKVDGVVLNNLASVYRHHPSTTVVTMSAGHALPNGYTLEATPDLKELHASNVSRGSDRLVCSWFLQRREKCHKWWIIEWDTFCSLSAQEYYRPVWDFPFVASAVRHLYREPEWYWFRERDKLPEEYRLYAMGGVPFLYLLSDDALSATCTALLQKPFSAGNGELRFCTVANKCGFAPCGFSPPNDHITWVPWNRLDGKNSVFHPVKRCFTCDNISKPLTPVKTDSPQSCDRGRPASTAVTPGKATQ